MLSATWYLALATWYLQLTTECFSCYSVLTYHLKRHPHNTINENPFSAPLLFQHHCVQITNPLVRHNAGPAPQPWALGRNMHAHASCQTGELTKVCRNSCKRLQLLLAITTKDSMPLTSFVAGAESCRASTAPGTPMSPCCLCLFSRLECATTAPSTLRRPPTPCCSPKQAQLHRNCRR